MARIVKPPVWEKRLDGWQAACVPVILIVAALAIGAPRAVKPDHLPLPRIDANQLGAVIRADRDRARAVEQVPLDVDVRRVGSAVVALNLATATGRSAEVQEAKIRLLQRVTEALHHGDEPLLALRAYQGEAFLAALKAWPTHTGDDQQPIKQQLIEMGGDFLERGLERGWVNTSPPKVRLTDEQLRVLFKLRWNTLTGLEQDAFALEVDEEKLRVGLLLERLPHRRFAKAIKLLDDLATIDSEYPYHFARGIVAYRQGAYARAARRFRDHLGARPDGPFTLRARNYLKASLDQVAGLP